MVSDFPKTSADEPSDEDVMNKEELINKLALALNDPDIAAIMLMLIKNLDNPDLLTKVRETVQELLAEVRPNNANSDLHRILEEPELNNARIFPGSLQKRTVELPDPQSPLDKLLKEIDRLNIKRPVDS